MYCQALSFYAFTYCYCFGWLYVCMWKCHGIHYAIIHWLTLCFVLFGHCMLSYNIHWALCTVLCDIERQSTFLHVYTCVYISCACTMLNTHICVCISLCLIHTYFLAKYKLKHMMYVCLSESETGECSFFCCTTLRWIYNKHCQHTW